MTKICGNHRFFDGLVALLEIPFANCRRSRLSGGSRSTSSSSSKNGRGYLFFAPPAPRHCRWSSKLGEYQGDLFALISINLTKGFGRGRGPLLSLANEVKDKTRNNLQMPVRTFFVNCGRNACLCPMLTFLFPAPLRWWRGNRARFRLSFGGQPKPEPRQIGIIGGHQWERQQPRYGGSWVVNRIQWLASRAVIESVRERPNRLFRISKFLNVDPPRRPAANRHP